jgi:hypothetical protein
MNPSASGWINSYIADNNYGLITYSNKSSEELYKYLKESGFIYGANVKLLVQKDENQLKLTQEEKAKVNLFAALCIVYYKETGNVNKNDCINQINKFYKVLNQSHKKLFSFTWIKAKPEEQLENILQQRIQTNDGFIQKNFSNIVTNALLFIDVLSFQFYLRNHTEPHNYSLLFEEFIVNTLYLALKEKKLKGKYDEMIIKLIQSSLRYYKIEANNFSTLDSLSFTLLTEDIEKYYIIDITCMTLYSDEIIDEDEKLFIENLANILGLPESIIEGSIDFLYSFIEKYKSEIYYFNISHPVKYFYDNTLRTVSVLLRRNKKRIIKEISESKELMRLLTISNHRELNEDEKQKVKTQILDILKTIPSLAIFALPGGTILLPLIIKMIPNILPSSFNENNLNKKLKK